MLNIAPIHRFSDARDGLDTLRLRSEGFDGCSSPADRASQPYPVLGAVAVRHVPARRVETDLEAGVVASGRSQPPAHAELPRLIRERSRLPDEVHGARAAGSLLVGDLGEAEAEFVRVRTRYLAGFLARLALLVPGVSLRLAWRVGVRRRLGLRSRLE